MSEVVLILLALVIGYVLGAIPPGYFYVKWATGQNLTEIESGRTGGTNSYRAAGAKVGLLTGASDILKGAIAIWLISALFADALGDLLAWGQAAAGIGAVVGHNWSVFLGFKGGAGTTPNVGWATAIWWPVLPIGLAILFGLFYFTGMASVVSLTLAAFLPIVFGIRFFVGIDTTAAYFVGSLITWAFITWSLRPNIKRIMEGNERVVGPRAKRLEKKKSISAD